MTDVPGREAEVAFPVLRSELAARLIDRAARTRLHAGEVLFRAGDLASDFIYLESGEVEIYRGPAPDDPQEVVLARHGSGRFLGEWNMLTGQAVYASCRVARPGVAHRISHAEFRRLLDEDADLSEILLPALLARRRLLLDNPAWAQAIEILGCTSSAPAHDLRTWAVRERLVHVYLDIDEPHGRALATQLEVSADDLPVVVTARATLRQATSGRLAELLGMSYQPDEGRVYDLVVVGAGPAGLAAAVYGASEGLDTLLVDAVAVGGQAAASSRIENYLGFPNGLSGGELTGRGLVQAQKFGARVATPCEVDGLAAEGGELRITLADGTSIAARSVVAATGAAYRRLPLERWAEFEGAGIFFAATEIEVRACERAPVAVVGGANSAGQAAIYLATRGSAVHLLLRGSDLAAKMSTYLVERIAGDPRITVRTCTEVTALHGDDGLQEITVTEHGSGASTRLACRGLFCFIGATPATHWLPDALRDEDGFLLTDQYLPVDRLPEQWTRMEREPLAFETSIPAVFAAGDVRLGSMKRVAAAVGEGASAVRSVHAAIGAPVG